MKQKIIKIGNSQGIIIPKEALDAVGIKPGEEVYIIPDPNTQALLISEKKVAPYAPQRNKFKDIIEELNKEYKDDLQELAGK